MMKKLLLYIALGAGLASCIYPYSPDLESDPERTLVVDGQILIGGISTFRLNFVMPLEGPSAGVALGNAWVEDDQGNRYDRMPDYVVQYDSPGGSYYGGGGYAESSMGLSNNIRVNTLNAPLGCKYRAVVECDGETYVSDWIEPHAAPEIKNISFGADDTSVTVYVDLDAGLDGSGYIGFMFDETWRFHSDFYPEYLVTNTEKWTITPTMELQFEYPYYWCWRNMDNQSVVLLDYTSFEGNIIQKFPLKSFPRTDSRNHQRYSINVKAFTLSKEAFQFNKEMEEISEIGGDLFTPDPGAIPGNFTCETHPEKEVMGLVLAGDVTSKRAFMGGEYYIYHEPYYDFAKVTEDQMPRYYYDMGWRPIKLVRSDEGDYIGWQHESCINCLLRGGYQTKPDFWED
jgi:hypothetical protein